MRARFLLIGLAICMAASVSAQKVGGILLDDNFKGVQNEDIMVTYELLKNGEVAQKKEIDTKTNASAIYKFDPKTEGKLITGDSCVESEPNDTLCFRLTITWGNGNSVSVPAEKIKKVPQSENANYAQESGVASTADFATDAGTAETAESANNAKNADFATLAGSANGLNTGIEDADLQDADIILPLQMVTAARGGLQRDGHGSILPRGTGSFLLSRTPQGLDWCSIFDVSDEIPAVFRNSSSFEDILFEDMISYPEDYFKTGKIYEDEDGFLWRIVYDPWTDRFIETAVSPIVQPRFFRDGSGLRLRGRGVETWIMPGQLAVENDAPVLFGFFDGVNLYSGMFGGVVCAQMFFQTGAPNIGAENIDDALGRVALLQPTKASGVSRAAQDAMSYGFDVEALENVFPELVRDVKAGNNNQGVTTDEMVKGINYTSLIPVLTKAIQEQQTQIEKQAQQIEELQALVRELADK